MKIKLEDLTIKQLRDICKSVDTCENCILYHGCYGLFVYLMEYLHLDREIDFFE